MALGIVVGAGIAAFVLTGGAIEWNDETFDVLRAVMVNAGTVGIIFAALIQLLLIGESSTMSAQKFSLFGIEDRTLTAGLYLSAFTGLPATCAFLSLLCASRLYVGYGTGAVLGGVLSAVLTVMVAMCFSKAALSLASQLTRTERGKNTLYILVTLLVVVAAQLPNIYVNTHTEEDFSAIDVNGLVRLTDVVGWLPFGWSLGCRSTPPVATPPRSLRGWRSSSCSVPCASPRRCGAFVANDCRASRRAACARNVRSVRSTGCRIRRVGRSPRACSSRLDATRAKPCNMCCPCCS